MPTPVTHVVRFVDPDHHLIEVSSRFPAPAEGPLELAMAVWTPGSYKVRDYSRHVQELAARGDGAPLAVEKTAKNRWRIDPAGASEVEVTYRVYGREMTVRTNWIGPELALLNGAATFLVPVDRLDLPHELTVVRPQEWTGVWTALPAVPGREDVFLARDWDHLVDSPVYAGSPGVHSFEVDGIPHLLVNEGEGDRWPGERSAAAAARLVAAAARLWGGLPYERYLFLNLVVEAGGGLEHRDSTVLMTSRWKAGTREGWLDWLRLVAHEHFHAWNVKRLRPVALGPFDYEREVYTPSLWVAEGITSYYDNLLVGRAGLQTRDELLRELAETIESVETTPGRAVRSLEEASFDAWIKLYQPDENTANTAVSYYRKGAVVAFLLDLEIRRATDGARSLDDVLRAAWARWGDAGYGEEELEALMVEIGGPSVATFLERTVRGTGELDYQPALAWLGLRFAPPKPAGDEDRPRDEKPGWLGAKTEVDRGRLMVREVRRGTPAWDAGLAVDDELIAIGGYRVPPTGLEERLKAFRPGDRVPLLVARRERLVTLEASLGEDPKGRWKLEPDPAASDEQKARLAAWLALPPS